MKTYKIKKGDTLGTIALKQLGAVGKWREIAEINNIINVNKIVAGQVLELPNIGEPEASTKKSDVIIIDEKDKVYYQYQNDATKRYLGSRFRKGISRRGSQNTEKFIEEHPALFSKLKISKSELNALLATSENEGNLDAINTYDNSYMSFGMFQWTLGAKSAKGELPALIKLVKEKSPKAFDQFCGQFGLDVSAETDTISGYLILNNKKIKTPADKQFFRKNIVAYRFAAAGLDKRVNAIQILHAINRFNYFYFNKSKKLGGYTLFDLLSSEYAAALFLDNHVNRPAYLLPCVARAIKMAGLRFDQLKNGGDEEALTVINHYLKIRETFGSAPMTHAKHRAMVIEQYLNDDRISAQKGSFISNRLLR